MVVIQSNVRDRDLVASSTKRRPRSPRRSSSGRSSLGADSSKTSDDRRKAGGGDSVALGLIFLLLFHPRHVRQAALVFANIPFALIGGVMRALWIGPVNTSPSWSASSR